MNGGGWSADFCFVGVFRNRWRSRSCSLACNARVGALGLALHLVELNKLSKMSFGQQDAIFECVGIIRRHSMLIGATPMIKDLELIEFKVFFHDLA